MVHNLDQILFIHTGSMHAHRHIMLITTHYVTIHGAIARTLWQTAWSAAWPYKKANVVTSLWIKPTDALKSNSIGIVSGSLSAHHQKFLAVHQLWYILCSCDDRLLPVGSSILLLAANGHRNCIICTKADVRLRTPDDGQKSCPKHVES